MSLIDEGLRREFEAAWFAGEPPDVAAYLPDGDAPTYAATLEELVSIDLEFRWRAVGSSEADVRHKSMVPDYCRRFPLLGGSGAVLRLIQEEFRLRSRTVSPPHQEEYVREFPHVLRDLGTADQLLRTESSPVKSVAGPGNVWGRYRLVRQHARGAFGEVWEAHDPVLDRTVALKILAPRYRSSAFIKQRFCAEARTTARLEHPGIVSVHDFQEAAEIPSYTMRLLGGETLSDSIRRHHERSTGSEHAVERLRLLTAFVTIVRTVEFAHARGVIHRDLKPDNIILGAYGETAILDWGLAKEQRRGEPAVEGTGLPAVDAGDAARTQMGTVVGTPAYMSPEQAEGRVDEIAEASDQFALGGILFEILTGIAPFPTGQSSDRNAFALPTTKAAGVPKPLLAICRQAMSYEPLDRYANVDAFAADLERFLADEPVSVYREDWQSRAARWFKRHRTLVSTSLSTAVVAALLLLIGFGWVLDANRRLARREQEAVQLRADAENSLAIAEDNLYGHRVALAHSEYAQNNIDRVDELLQACPVEQRNWEWQHLASLVDQDRPDQLIAGHRAPILCVAVSANGRWVASGDSAGVVWLRRVDGTTPPRSFQHSGQVRHIVFAGNDEHFYTASTEASAGGLAGSIRRWSIESGQSVAALAAHGVRCTSLAWDDQHGALFSGGADDRVTRRDPVTLAEIEPSWQVGHPIRCVSVTTDEDGRWLLAAGDDRGTLRMWDVTTAECVLSLSTGFGRVYDCALRPDGRALAAVGDGKWVMRWQLQPATDVSDWRIVKESFLLGHADQLRAVRFSRRGDTLATAGFDRSVCFWRGGSTEPVMTLRSHTSHVRALAFGPEGESFITGSDDGRLRIWRPAPHDGTELILGYVTFARSGTAAAVQTERHLEVRDIATRTRLWRKARDSHEGMIADFSPDGTRLATLDRDGSVAIWQAHDGLVERQIPVQNARAHSVKFVGDESRLAVGYGDGCVKIWDGVAHTTLRRFDPDGAVLRLADTPDGRHLIAGHATGSVGVWDVEHRRLRCEFSAQSRALFDLALHPDGDRLATTGPEGVVTLWDWQRQRPIWKSKVGASWLNALAFTPDGRRLISGSEQTITYWDVETGREIVSLSVDRCVHRLSFSADGRWLALSGEDPHVRLWQSR